MKNQLEEKKKTMNPSEKNAVISAIVSLAIVIILHFWLHLKQLFAIFNIVGFGYYIALFILFLIGAGVLNSTLNQGAAMKNLADKK